MPLYKTETINIRTMNIGEADKLVTLLSLEYGKIKAVAKGARRTTSKFGGRLEIFTFNDMLLATGKNLDIISQCETIESFYKIREDQDKLRTGIYFIKLIDLTTEDRQRNEGLFKLLLNSLHLLNGTNGFESLSRYFEIKLIEVEGLFPDLDKLHCSNKLKEGIALLKDDHNAYLEFDVLKGIERLFKRLIGEHIGMDLNNIKFGGL